MPDRAGRIAQDRGAFWEHAINPITFQQRGTDMPDRRKREPIILARATLFDMRQELAWQAALMDGEGTITICCQIRKGRPSPAFRPHVTITNTNPDLVSPFQTMWGGNAYRSVDSRTDKQWSDSFDWYCKQTTIVEFLTALMPYLRAKRKQAELVLEFIKTRHDFPRAFVGKGGKSSLRGSAPLGKAEIAHRKKLQREIQLLNAKSRVYRQERKVMPDVTHRMLV